MKLKYSGHKRTLMKREPWLLAHAEEAHSLLVVEEAANY